MSMTAPSVAGSLGSRGRGSLPLLIPIPHPAAATTGSTRSARSMTTTGTRPISKLLVRPALVDAVYELVTKSPWSFEPAMRSPWTLGFSTLRDRALSAVATLLSGAGQEVLDDERRGRRGTFDEPEEGAEVPGGGEPW